MSGRQHHQSTASAVEERIALQDERAGSFADGSRKGTGKAILCARLNDNQLLPERVRSRLRVVGFAFNRGIARFTKKAIVSALGSSSCRSSNCFATNCLPQNTAPVALPSGLLRLLTKPSYTGSARVT